MIRFPTSTWLVDPRRVTSIFLIRALIWLLNLYMHCVLCSLLAYPVDNQRIRFKPILPILAMVTPKEFIRSALAIWNMALTNSRWQPD
ncbi:uncharacterized protein BDW70DRAFT_53939 [Aspergillus foveolatus]|uniref:uncharacterized protein n=1 Tax=Aspergillus foveolatus TaxID=210207 RepID=UPI003CCD3F6F